MLKTLVLSAPLMLCAYAAWAESHATEAVAAETDLPAGISLAAEDVDLDAAQKIFKKSCRACHGNKAQGASSYPQLNDKEPEYIAQMLVRYREGEKIGPNSVLMIQNAKKLSDEDIANISVYVATAFD